MLYFPSLVCWNGKFGSQLCGLFDSTKNRPCLGSCGHSVCTPCLDRNLNLKCPICGLENAFIDRKINYTALNFIEMFSENCVKVYMNWWNENQETIGSGYCSICESETDFLRICVDCELSAPSPIIEYHEEEDLVSLKIDTVSISKLPFSLKCVDCIADNCLANHKIRKLQQVKNSAIRIKECSHDVASRFLKRGLENGKGRDCKIRYDRMMNTYESLVQSVRFYCIETSKTVLFDKERPGLETQSTGIDFLVKSLSSQWQEYKDINEPLEKCQCTQLWESIEDGSVLQSVFNTMSYQDLELVTRGCPMDFQKNRELRNSIPERINRNRVTDKKNDKKKESLVDLRAVCDLENLFKSVKVAGPPTVTTSGSRSSTVLRISFRSSSDGSEFVRVPYREFRALHDYVRELGKKIEVIEELMVQSSPNAQIPRIAEILPLKTPPSRPVAPRNSPLPRRNMRQIKQLKQEKKLEKPEKPPESTKSTKSYTILVHNADISKSELPICTVIGTQIAMECGAKSLSSVSILNPPNHSPILILEFLEMKDTILVLRSFKRIRETVALCSEAFVEIRNSTQNRPCLGSCGHSVCTPCLDKNPNIKCPICGLENAFIDRKINYTALNFIEMFSENCVEVYMNWWNENQETIGSGYCSSCESEMYYLRICVDCELSAPSPIIEYHEEEDLVALKIDKVSVAKLPLSLKCVNCFASNCLANHKIRKLQQVKNSAIQIKQCSHDVASRFLKRGLENSKGRDCKLRYDRMMNTYESLVQSVRFYCIETSKTVLFDKERPDLEWQSIGIDFFVKSLSSQWKEYKDINEPSEKCECTQLWESIGDENVLQSVFNTMSYQDLELVTRGCPMDFQKNRELRNSIPERIKRNRGASTDKKNDKKNKKELLEDLKAVCDLENLFKSVKVAGPTMLSDSSVSTTLSALFSWESDGSELVSVPYQEFRALHDHVRELEKRMEVVEDLLAQLVPHARISRTARILPLKRPPPRPCAPRNTQLPKGDNQPRKVQVAVYRSISNPDRPSDSGVFKDPPQ